MHVQHFWEDTCTGIWMGLEKREPGASRVTREVASGTQSRVAGSMLAAPPSLLGTQGARPACATLPG